MSAAEGQEGHISRQSASYRQGLVLGLTMAEVMILLVFCLLIALAAFLQTEHAKLVEAQDQLRNEKEAALADRDFAESVKKDPRLAQLLKSRPSLDDQTKLDEFWRELVEGRSVVTAARQNGLTPADLRSRMADLKAIKEKGIDLTKIERDALITASVDKMIAPSGAATPEQVARLIAQGLAEKARPLQKAASPGNKWPPIIALNDANGRFFKTGSAEVDPDFHRVLIDKTAPRIAELIKEYDVDVIEVVGHTDERPLGSTQSNLDRDLVSVLNGTANIAAIKPGDNAGLGLARAVSVVGILRQSKELSGYKILPLSGGQLINTNETLALGASPGDVRERRRIEIRLRKTTIRDTVPQQKNETTQKLADPGSVTPLPSRKPVMQSSSPAFIGAPTQLFPPSLR